MMRFSYLLSLWPSKRNIDRYFVAMGSFRDPSMPRVIR
jgi:hypothetical protein